jgi:hypothetical protein
VSKASEYAKAMVMAKQSAPALAVWCQEMFVDPIARTIEKATASDRTPAPET